MIPVNYPAGDISRLPVVQWFSTVGVHMSRPTGRVGPAYNALVGKLNDYFPQTVYGCWLVVPLG